MTVYENDYMNNDPPYFFRIKNQIAFTKCGYGGAYYQSFSKPVPAEQARVVEYFLPILTSVLDKGSDEGMASEVQRRLLGLVAIRGEARE